MSGLVEAPNSHSPMMFSLPVAWQGFLFAFIHICFSYKHALFLCLTINIAGSLPLMTYV